MRSKILYVFGGEKAQGAEIVIERLMGANMDNVEPHLFIAPGKFSAALLNDNKPYNITLVDELKKLNRSSSSSLKFYLTALRNYFTVSCKVFKYIKKHNINIIHANTIVPSSYLVPLIIFSKIFLPSKIWVWSDHDIKYYSKLDHLLSNVCASLYNHTLVVSNAVKRKYSNKKGVSVLYNGLDTNIFKPDEGRGKAFKAIGGFDTSSIVFGMAAVIDPSKGQLKVIEAFNGLSKANADICLVFAGNYAADHPDYNKAVQNGINSNNQILHAGFVADMVGFYNACDVIISNSADEPLGTNIYEAMACNKIVLATNSGGTPEIIDDRVDGFLFDKNSPDGLKTEMAYIIDNYNSLGTIKENARTKVLNKFNIILMLANYNRLLFTPDNTDETANIIYGRE